MHQPLCAGYLLHNVPQDLRYLWMELKTLIGSHFATYDDANKALELVASGKIKVITDSVNKISTLPEKLDYLYEGDIVTFSKDIYVYSTNKMSKTMKKIANGNPLQIMFNIFLKKGMKLYCDGNTIIFPYKTVFIIKRGRLLGYEGSSVMSYNVNLGGFRF